MQNILQIILFCTMCSLALGGCADKLSSDSDFSQITSIMQQTRDIAKVANVNTNAGVGAEHTTGSSSVERHCETMANGYHCEGNSSSSSSSTSIHVGI